MDIVAMNNPTSAMAMEDGEIINGLTSKMWVERYADAGEFRFLAPVDSQLRKKMPIGSFVTHLDTPEIMIVENHEIAANKGEEDILTVTGTSWETYLKQRIVGCNHTFPRLVPSEPEGWKYVVPGTKTWNQIKYVIKRHVDPEFMVDDNDSIHFLTVDTDISGGDPGDVEERSLDFRDLYSTVLDLMAMDDTGIKMIRPGYWSPLGVGDPNSLLLIHKGVDRRDTLVFTYDSGQIESADYLWTNKNRKTAALVVGRWVSTMVRTSGYFNYGRRMMYLDATDIDEVYADRATVELLESFIVARMKARGKQALRSQKDINLTKVDVDKSVYETRYRQDFNVGDIVRVLGDYNEAAPMRVTEFVEIEDETGTFSYPTLSSLNDEEAVDS